MAWGDASACPCGWDAGFGQVNCAPQTPGADRQIVILCRDKLESLTETAADDANPDTTGVITAVTIESGEQGYVLTALKDTVNMQSGETVNDNGGKDVNEVITGIGTISTESFNWLKNYIGKEVVAFIRDNDEVLWCFGHSGGLFLNDWNADWGTVQGDAKGVTFNFTNTSKAIAKEVVVADDDVFFTQITSPATP